MQQLDAQTGESIAALERAVKEEVATQATELRTAVANMGDYAGRRLDALETEVPLQSGAASASAPHGAPPRDTSPIFSGANSVPGAAAAPLAFPQCGAAAPGMTGATAACGSFGAGP